MLLLFVTYVSFHFVKWPILTDLFFDWAINWRPSWMVQILKTVPEAFRIR